MAACMVGIEMGFNDLGSSLLRNSIYNVLYRTLGIVFPFFASVYVAHVLMADSVGKVAAAQNFVSYFTLLAGMGIPTYGVKLIAQFEVKSEESGKAFTELFLINFALSISCSLIYYIVIFIHPFFRGKETVYAVCGLSVLFNVFNVDWFYQGIQEYKYIAARSLAIKFLSLFALMCFVRKPQDYVMYALISTGALVGNYIFNIVHLKKYRVFRFKNLHYSDHLREIFVLFLAGLAAEIYVLADTSMLDVMCGSEIVGYYTMSLRIVRIIRGLVVASAAVYLPQLSHYYYSGDKERFSQLSNRGIHTLTALSVPAAAGIALVASEAVTVFFGSGFMDSVPATRILAISIVTVAYSNYIGLQFFVTLGKGKLTTISTVCGAVTNITLNYFLIRPYQHVGAAIASVITEGLVAVVQLVMARKYIRFEFGWKKVLPAVLSMTACVLLLSMLKLPPVTALILKCGLGALVYGGVLLATKDELALNIQNAICKKSRQFIGRKHN